MSVEATVPSRVPTYERETVGEKMRRGVIACPAEASLRQVATTMAAEMIHCVIVPDGDGWGVVSDLDLLRAADADLDLTMAGDVAASDLPTVAPQEALARAAQVMVEHEVTHVLVVDPASLEPVGVLSTLDVADSLAG